MNEGPGHIKKDQIPQVSEKSRFSFSSVNFPDAVTKEQRAEIEKNLKRYTDKEQYQKAMDICRSVEKQIIAENVAKNGPALEELADVDARLKELNSQRRRIFQEDKGKENLSTIIAEELPLKEHRTELRKSLTAVNPFSQEAKQKKDGAISAAGFLDDVWRLVAVAPTNEPEVLKELKRMGWNGKDNGVYATEYGFVSHHAAHHPDMTEAEIQYDMLQNLYSADKVGFIEGHEDGLVFIRKVSDSAWYTTVIKINDKKRDGSLLFGTTYKDKENPSKKLTRIVSLSHQRGAAASSQILLSFGDSDAKVTKKSEPASESYE